MKKPSQTTWWGKQLLELVIGEEFVGVRSTLCFITCDRWELLPWPFLQSNLLIFLTLEPADIRQVLVIFYWQSQKLDFCWNTLWFRSSTYSRSFMVNEYCDCPVDWNSNSLAHDTGKLGLQSYCSSFSLFWGLSFVADVILLMIIWTNLT